MYLFEIAHAFGPSSNFFQKSSMPQGTCNALPCSIFPILDEYDLLELFIVTRNDEDPEAVRLIVNYCYI